MTTEQQTVAEIIQDIQESRRYPSLHALINAGMTSARVHYKSAAGALDEDDLLEAQEAGFDAAEDSLETMKPLKDFQLDWLASFFKYKIFLDKEYERETHEENEGEFKEDLFTAYEVDDESARLIFDKLKAMETRIHESERLGDYLKDCDRETAWELYLSTSGHGAGFFDHSTDEADEIQAILDKEFRYATEDWHFYCREGKLHFQG